MEATQDVEIQISYPGLAAWVHRVTEPAIRSAIGALELPEGSRGLDAGCGIGTHTLWLADAISPHGHVVGVDRSSECLAHAERAASSWTSGVFGLLPIVTLRSRGGVPKGQSYVKTTQLVTSGIYAVVRHPQNGTAWLLINLGVMFVAQHRSSWLLGLISMALAYADTFKADQGCIAKFGDAYRHYVQRVPRVNFVLGLVRLAWHKARAR